MKEFSFSTRIFFGEGALERLRKVGFPIAYIDSHMMPEGDIPGLAEKFDRWVEE